MGLKEEYLIKQEIKRIVKEFNSLPEEEQKKIIRELSNLPLK